MIVTAQNHIKDMLGGNTFPALESPSLRLNKLLRYEKRSKNDELNLICNSINEHGHKFSGADIAVNGDVEFEMQLGGRMMVNQAGGILNASIEIHPFCGFPVIPGSALKGIARHAAWCDWANAIDLEDDDEARELAEKMSNTFGYQPAADKQFDSCLNPEKDCQAGNVVFFQAVPANNNWKIVVDVLTSHHRDNKKCDTKNPVPVFFPAVEKNAAFRFSLSKVKNRGNDDSLNFAVKYLKRGLMNIGAGAKSSAGYGWFEEY